MNIYNILLIISIVIYVIASIAYFVNRSKESKAISQLKRNTISMFFWEKRFLKKVPLDKKYVKPVIYGSRTVLVIIVLGISFKIGAIALFLTSAIFILVFADKQTGALIDKAGINSIPELNEFLDSYIPALSSGLSNDQAMMKYINGKNDESLYEWWENRDNKSYIVENKWKRIVEVYIMIKFNEDRGIEDSLPIIEQMQKDISVKQSYYNDYKAKMGEIQPILLSYYIFVPVLLFISLGQTKDFWFGIWGYLAAIGLIILFIGSQIMVYKIKQSTIKVMF